MYCNNSQGFAWNACCGRYLKSFGVRKWLEQHHLNLAMANFNVKFLDSNDDLAMLTQHDRSRDGNNNEIEMDMEEAMNSSMDSAVGSLASVKHDTTDSENDEIINVAERHQPMVKDISDGDE